VQTQDHAWTSTRTISLLVAAIALLVGFLLHETTLARKPLVTFEIFKARAVTGANVVAVLVGAALLAMFYLLSLYEQQVLHYSALKTGLSYLPLTAMMTACAFLAPVRIPKIGIRAVILLGSIIATVGLVLFARMTPTGDLWSDVIGPSLVVGPGLALTFIPMNMAAVSGVEPENVGLASGVPTSPERWVAPWG